MTNELESRLRESLRGAAEGAPAPHDLAGGARSRARARRRWLAGASVAAVAAIVVPVALLAGGTGERAGPGDPTPTTPDASRPAGEGPNTWRTEGWRTESWHDIEVAVPEEWEYGSLSTWCLSKSDPPAPVVERPGGVVPAILCSPSASGFGLQFLPAGDLEPVQPVHEVGAGKDFPRGAWVGEVVLGFAGVRVVAPEPWLAKRVLGSAHVIDGADHNGCPSRETIGSTEDPGIEGSLSVCRYDESGWLEQSELLIGSRADQALQAIEDAPIRAEASPCQFPPDRSPVVVLRMAGDELARVVWDAVCATGNGVFQHGVARELTTDVMYWSLSPGWSGALGSTYPLPDQFRD